MKRLLVILLCALTAFSFGGCTLLNNQTAQNDTVHIYYLETEDVDDSYAIGMYFSFPSTYCDRYIMNLNDFVDTLAENTAYEMYAKVFGLSGATAKPNPGATDGTLTLGTGSIKWRAQYVYSRAKGVEFLAQVVAEDREALNRYLGEADGFAYGFAPSWDNRVEYTDTMAYYEVGGYRYENPWTDALRDWNESYAQDGAMKALWQGNSGAGVDGLNKHLSADAFNYMSGDRALTAYQFTSWHINGCNGYYAKNSGTRTCSWGAKVGGSLEMPSVYLRVPKVWAWYLTAFGIVALLGVALFFSLRSGRKTMERINPVPPSVPPQSPPPSDPFGGGYSQQKPKDDNPFGSDYN